MKSNGMIGVYVLVVVASLVVFTASLHGALYFAILAGAGLGVFLTQVEWADPYRVYRALAFIGSLGLSFEFGFMVFAPPPLSAFFFFLWAVFSLTLVILAIFGKKK